MKAVIFDRPYGHALPLPPRVEVSPASAIQPAGRQPLFLNAEMGEQTGELCLGYRISRLGKAIGAEFASRYYDAVGVCLLVRPSVTACVPPGLAWMTDCSFVVGDWQPLNPGGVYELASGDMHQSLSDSQLGICEAIAAVSRFATLQQGDIIVPSRSMIAFPLRGDTRVEAWLNGVTAFELKIK